MALAFVPACEPLKELNFSFASMVKITSSSLMLLFTRPPVEPDIFLCCAGLADGAGRRDGAVPGADVEPAAVADAGEGMYTRPGVETMATMGAMLGRILKRKEMLERQIVSRALAFFNTYSSTERSLAQLLRAYRRFVITSVLCS